MKWKNCVCWSFVWVEYFKFLRHNEFYEFKIVEEEQRLITYKYILYLFERPEEKEEKISAKYKITVEYRIWMKI